MQFIDLKIPAILVACVLPLLSALLLAANSRRYLVCVGQAFTVYAAMFVMIAAGYAFQTMVSVEPFSHYQSAFRMWERIQIALLTEFRGAENTYMNTIVSSVVACALLLARNDRSRTTNTLRAAFCSFMAFDILTGIESNATVATYIYDTIFNILGAFVLSVVAALLFEWIPYRGRRPVLLSRSSS